MWFVFPWNSNVYIPVCGVGVVTTAVPLLVEEHVVDNASGIQIGVRQQLFITQTDVFDAHVLEVVHVSSNEQAT